MIFTHAAKCFSTKIRAIFAALAGSSMVTRHTMSEPIFTPYCAFLLTNHNTLYMLPPSYRIGHGLIPDGNGKILSSSFEKLKPHRQGSGFLEHNINLFP